MSLTNFPKNSNFFFLGGLYILYPQYHSILVEEGEYGEIFFGFCLKKRHILIKFELCKKFSALGQNQRDARDYSASGRGCVMRDCRIERNTTVFDYNKIPFHSILT